MTIDNAHQAQKGKLPTVKELLATNNQLLKDQKFDAQRNFFVNVLMIIATIFLAFAAGYDAITNKDEVLSHRPYISIEPALSQKEELRFGFTTQLKNIGGRATAPGTSIGIYPIRIETKDNLKNYVKSPPNSLPIPQELIPGSAELTFSTDLLPDKKPNFLIIKLKYKDDILQNPYEQIFYYNWSVGDALSLITDENVWKDLALYFEKND